MELNRYTKTPRKLWMWGVAGIALVILVCAGWWFMRQTDTLPQVREQLLAKHSSFPLMYFKVVPEGVKVISESVETHEGAIMFGLSKNANRVTVTQQARPKFIEEVNKVKDVSVPVGKAYVARLNERTVGFLLTDTTLVIVSAVQPLDADSITAILSNLVNL